MARKARRETLTPELTPLIDVVFLLLIFFLVSSVFKKEELSLLMTLPKSEQGKGDNKNVQKSITIEMTGSDLAFEGEKLNIEELSSKLSTVNAKTLINLRADGDVKYQRLVKVLDALKKNKLENVSLITKKEKK